ERVVVNYDTANAIFYGEENLDLEADLKSAVDKVGHIHLKDKAGAQREWNFPALGRGNINFEALFRLLKEEENNSPFSIEIEFTEDGPPALAEVNQAVKDSYQFLKKAGFEI
ncbi:MAG: sugar phosphate isomerase/epimerase family protein, partial [Halanaerobium sp.]